MSPLAIVCALRIEQVNFMGSKSLVPFALGEVPGPVFTGSLFHRDCLGRIPRLFLPCFVFCVSPFF